MSKRVANRRGPSRNKAIQNTRRKYWIMKQFGLSAADWKKGKRA